MKYHILLHAPKKRIKEKQETDFSEKTMKSAEEVFKMLNNTEADWFLVGGLEASILFGSITRPHTDIDIEIDETQIPLLSKGMKKFGYNLYERVASIPVPSNLLSTPFSNYLTVAVYKEINHKRKTKSKDLRLVNKKINTIDSLIGIIDVKICQRTENGATIYNNGKPIKVNKPYLGKTTQVGNQTVKCRNTDYLKLLKSNSKKMPDAYDLILLDVAMSKHNYKKE